MFYFASKGGYYLSAAFIQERPLIKHIRYLLLAQKRNYNTARRRYVQLIFDSLMKTATIVEPCRHLGSRGKPDN